MDLTVNVSPGLGDYQPAILALIIAAIIALIQSFVGAYFGFVKGGGVPGAPVSGDHGDLGFRALRCYQNAVENLPAFAVAVVIAIVAGASASLVNILALLHLAARVIYSGIYYAGIGKPAGGPRSLAYIAGWAINLLLAFVALFALVT